MSVTLATKDDSQRIQFAGVSYRAPVRKALQRCQVIV